eukprot:5368612-Pleurochrysis_carterae.AAC.1
MPGSNPQQPNPGFQPPVFPDLVRIPTVSPYGQKAINPAALPKLTATQVHGFTCTVGRRHACRDWQPLKPPPLFSPPLPLVSHSPS